jgi:hypothetical protein
MTKRRWASAKSAPPGAGTEGLSAARRAFRHLRGEQGQSLVEFALLCTVLFFILVGIVVFGMAFNNYLALTSATSTSAQQVAVNRGQTTDPCNLVAQAVTGQTPFNLASNQPNLAYTLVISPPSGQSLPNPSSGSTSATYTGTGNSFSCSSSSTATGAAGNLIANGSISLTVTYPCNLKVYGVNFAPSGCTLTAETQEAIQ